ncbi:hypothetical protein GGE65_007577 [Skermanella aerolata]|uniref:hypothetical protein n=1 Tax=Skermanella aerolata TaxID=393310 RepID=UPI003D1AD339
MNKRMEVISLGRGGSYKIAVWSFRVFSRDAATGRDLAVPIEMRAKNEIRAALRDGDEVVIESKWRWGQTLRPHIVQSAYTGERTYIGNDPYNELLMRWILGLLWVSAVCFLLPLPMMVVTYVFIVGFFAYSLYVRAKYG